MTDNSLDERLVSEYDVSGPNQRSAAFQRSGRRMGWSTITIGNAGAALLLGHVYDASNAAPLTLVQWALVPVALAMAVLFTVFGARLVQASRPGARSVRLDPEGIDLRYPDGSADRIGFADTRLSLELRDTSIHPELAARIPLYSIVVRRRETKLTEEAYGAIYQSLSAHGLITRSDRAHSLLIPQSVQPMIHYVRGNSGRR
jgi:hypothetical protein